MASTEKSFTVTDENVTFGAEQPFRYRGYVYDEETGFYYLQSRYYNPEHGRFISADVYLSTGQGVLGHNAYAYCLNNPVNSCDPAGLWSWGGFLTGLAIAVVGVVCVAACVASAGTLTPLVAVGVATASTALVTTGVTMSYAAATDSTMVMDLSCSYSINNCYAKIGVSCVIDFSDQRGELYPHIGGGIGKQVGLTYSVGLVENYNNAGDYAGSFIDASVGKHIGVDHCFSPDKHYSNTVKATSIVFSAVSESISWGADMITTFSRSLYSEEYYMDFEYAVYVRAGLIVPLCMLLFSFGLVIIGVFSFARAETHTLLDFLKKVGMLIVVFCIFSYVSIPSSLKYTIHLVREKETDSLYTEGTVISITPISNSPRYSTAEDNVVRASIVNIDGKNYYFMTAEGLFIGETIGIEYLPNSHIVLSWKVADG